MRKYYLVSSLPDEYCVTTITRSDLRNENFTVGGIDADARVRTFFDYLHRVVLNAGLVEGTRESKTDSLVSYLLMCVAEFASWPLAVRCVTAKMSCLLQC